MDIGILHVPAPLRSAYPVPGIGATIGLAYAFYLFPLDFFEGHGAFWQAPPIEDIATEITALRYYVADQWHFPLFRTVGIAPPRGISITYMDALPLLAVFAKFLKHVFSVEWNYFGLWIGLCYVLQGLSAVFLLQALGVRGWLPAATVAALAVFTPAFLFRLFHTALNGHFLILLALALYFLAIRRSAFDRVWPWFCSLAWVSLWVQAYFFVMILTIFIGTAVQTAVRHRRGWPLAAAAIGVCIGGSLLLMWVSGFFWERSGWDPLAIGSPKWFGIGSMNVLSPVIPQWSEFFPGIAKAFGAAKGPYAAVGVIDATGGQYEGYNYLGAGILLLAAVALWLVRRDFALLLRKHWGLIAACVALTALAVTHRIEVGKWELLLFDEVPLVLENIRSSGRLFWPVGYLATAGAVALIAHRAGRLCVSDPGKAVDRSHSDARSAVDISDLRLCPGVEFLEADRRPRISRLGVGYAREYRRDRPPEERRLRGRGDVGQACGARQRGPACVPRSALCGSIRRRPWRLSAALPSI